MRILFLPFAVTSIKIKDILSIVAAARIPDKGRQAQNANVCHYPRASCPRYNKTIACFDFINLMCYDLKTGPNHSPVWYSKTTINYWKQFRNVPAEKIVLGMPLYDGVETILRLPHLAGDGSRLWLHDFRRRRS